MQMERLKGLTFHTKKLRNCRSPPKTMCLRQIGTMTKLIYLIDNSFEFEHISADEITMTSSGDGQKEFESIFGPILKTWIVRNFDPREVKQMSW